MCLFLLEKSKSCRFRIALSGGGWNVTVSCGESSWGRACYGCFVRDRDLHLVAHSIGKDCDEAVVIGLRVFMGGRVGLRV